MDSGGTVSIRIGLLQAGEAEAAQRLWEHFPRLVDLARAGEFAR